MPPQVHLDLSGGDAPRLFHGPPPAKFATIFLGTAMVVLVLQPPFSPRTPGAPAVLRPCSQDMGISCFFQNAVPGSPDPFPRDRFFILSRFLTAPGPENRPPEAEKNARNRALQFFPSAGPLG